MSMKNVILNNWGIKLLALFLAIATWLYIVVELDKGATEEMEALQGVISSYTMVSKSVPINLKLEGNPSEGYKVQHDKIVIKPSICVIVGPRSYLRRLLAVDTYPIDITGHTKTLVKDISIISPFKGIDIKEKFVTVTIPIVKSAGE